MKLRRKIYEGLIAQNEALAAALHEEKSKRQLWTRKYYTLLLGIESARREADCGMDAAPTRFGINTNGTGGDAYRPYPQVTTSYDPDGFYTSHSLNTLEAFGALPCRTVANAYCDAPPTVALTTDLTRPVPTAGGYGDGTPLPSTVPACSASRANSRGPLSLDTNTFITPAV